MQDALSQAHIRERKEFKCDQEPIKLRELNRHPINKGEAQGNSIPVKEHLDMDQPQLLTVCLSEEEETVEVDLSHNIEVTNHNVDQELEASPQELLIVDGDSQIQEPENTPAHVEANEETVLVEITDLEEAEEEVSDTPAFIVKAQIMTKGTALRMSSVISRNAVLISADERKNSHKDHRLGRTPLSKLKVKPIRLMKNFHRLQGTK